jgi:hypothetical protein
MFNDILNDDVEVDNEEKLAVLSMYKVVRGDLYITGSCTNNYNIELSLEKVGGNLVIENTWFDNLDFFKSLHTVGKRLQISSNHYLQNIDGLKGIGQVNGGIEIQKNNELISLAGLQGLFLFSGELTISYNERLYEKEAEYVRDSLKELGWEGRDYIYFNRTVS